MNKKTQFYVWHSICEAIGQPDEVLTQDGRNSMVVPYQLGRVFRLSEFTVFFYRVCILAFDLQEHGNHIKSAEFNLVKKLLFMFERLERTAQGAHNYH